MKKAALQRLATRLCTVHFAAVALILIIGITFIKLAPPLWGIDEVTHFSRVYQLSEGHLRASRLDGGAYGGMLPSNLVTLNNYVYKDLTDNQAAHYFYDAHDVDSVDAYAKLTSQPFGSAQKDYNFSGAAVYSPFAYIGSLSGLIVAKVLHTNIGTAISFARFGTLLVYAALVGAALWLLRNNKAKWLVLVIALLPESVFQASIVNVDSLAIGESLLLFAVLLQLWERRNVKHLRRHLFIALAALAVLLPLTKPNYFVLTLPLLFLPSKLWQSKKQAWIYKVCVIGIACLIMLAWAYLTRDAARGIALVNAGIPEGSINPIRQVIYMLTHPITAVGSFVQSWAVYGGLWINNFFGVLGWNYVGLPMALVTTLIGLLVLATIATHDVLNDLSARIQPRFLFIGAGLLTILSIFAVFYMTYTPVGGTIVGGLQGRYFLPGAAFVLAGLGALLPMKVTLSEKAAPTLYFSVLTVCLVASVYVYHSVLY